MVSPYTILSSVTNANSSLVSYIKKAEQISHFSQASLRSWSLSCLERKIDLYGFIDISSSGLLSFMICGMNFKPALWDAEGPFAHSGK